jgi:hypothetical protein
MKLTIDPATSSCAPSSEISGLRSRFFTALGASPDMNCICETPFNATTGKRSFYSGFTFSDECQKDSAILEILIRPSFVPPIVSVGTG